RPGPQVPAAPAGTGGARPAPGRTAPSVSSPGGSRAVAPRDGRPARRGSRCTRSPRGRRGGAGGGGGGPREPQPRGARGGGGGARLGVPTRQFGAYLPGPHEQHEEREDRPLHRVPVAERVATTGPADLPPAQREAARDQHHRDGVVQQPAWGEKPAHAASLT